MDPSKNIWTEFARSYEEVISRLHCHQRLIDKALKHTGQARVVIDAGCGTGIISERFIERGETVYGFDNNPSMLEFAKNKRLKKSPEIQSRWHLGEGDVSTFPNWVPKDAEAIILNNVLFYIREPLKVLDESRSHLKDGGVLIVTGPKERPNMPKIFEHAIQEWKRDGADMKAIQGALDRFVEASRKLTTDPNEMVTFFQPEEMANELKKRGFSKILEANGEEYYGESFLVAAQV